MGKSKIKKSLDAKVSKAKKRGKRIARLLVILLILWILTLIFAPSEAKFEDSAISTIQDLELPASKDNDEIISHTGYTLCYDDKYEQARWVAYELTREELYGSFERTDNFRPDFKAQYGSASLNDYKGSGYDRGHLIPAADSNWSAEAMDDSFYLTNMSPQDPQFNRGIWSNLESAVRNFVDTDGALYIVTGPVLTDGPYETIGKNKVAVPKQYYKVLLDYTEPTIKAIAFLLPNKGSSEPLESFATTIDQVEELTKLDFFPKLPDTQESMLEGSYDVQDWDFGNFRSDAKTKSQYASVEKKVMKKASPVYTLAKNTLTGILVLVKKESLSLIKSIVPENILGNVTKAFD